MLVALLVASAGCSLLRQTDKAFVADVSAERLYQVDRYRRLCQSGNPPATCKKMQSYLNELEDCDEKGMKPDGVTCVDPAVGLVPLANRVQQIGALPTQERKELADLMNQLRRLP